MLLVLTMACNQDSQWETFANAGKTAYRQGRYTEAEQQWQAALREAEQFGEQDTRLATSLNDLGELYRSVGKYGEAEPLYWRAGCLQAGS